jgi:hypothetical protein
MSLFKRVAVISDDEESSDYDKNNITFNNLENTFRMKHTINHSPESTTEHHISLLSSEKPKRTYKKKTCKEKEEAKLNKERKRSQKKEIENVSIKSQDTELNTSADLSYTNLLQDNNRVIRELLSKVNAYEEILTEMGHNPIQLWKSRLL